MIIRELLSEAEYPLSHKLERTNNKQPMDELWQVLLSSPRNKELLADFGEGTAIGKGGFAYVFRTLRLFDDKPFAVKVYSKLDKKASRQRTELLRAESQLLRSLRQFTF